MMFSSANRQKVLEKLQKEYYDVIVIGGGITGAGITLDAVTRGLKVALIEMHDFASGTSSRSTKLVHGGLRYLKQFEIKMVAEVGKERAIVYKNGPHVTTPEWMLLPIHNRGTFGKFSTSIGLRIYDFLAQVNETERRRMLSRNETLQLEPLIKESGLKGGGYYVEYRTDDARLTLEVIKAAVSSGAHALNYLKADSFLYERNRITGVNVTDLLSGKSYQIFGKKIVNATGPWVDLFREKEGSIRTKQLRLTKGVHIVIDQKDFPLKQAVYFDTPDKRMIFAIPRDGKTYVGTTDTFYEGDPATPKMTLKDRDYLMEAILYMFPNVKLTAAQIESSWAGVRPLIYEEGKDPSEISRKDEIWESETGLISIAGGKLTGYRKMAEEVVDLLVSKFKKEGILHSVKPCQTRDLPLSGGNFGNIASFRQYIKEKTKEAPTYGLTEEKGYELVRCYGSNVPILFRYVKEYIDSGKTQLTPLIYARLMYAIHYEMAVTPLDFFSRRTGGLFFNINWVRKWKDPIIHYMREILQWSDEQTSTFKQELERALLDAVVPLKSDAL